MKQLCRRLLALAVASFLAGLSIFPVSAQTSSSRAAAVQSGLNQIKKNLNKLPAQRKMLSAAALNLLQISDNWSTLVQGGSHVQTPQRPAGAFLSSPGTSV